MNLEKFRSDIHSKYILKSIFYFMLSTIITWWFIEEGNMLYENAQLMLFSCGIAGAKWGIQILAAFFLLAQKKWIFIERLGFTCFMGSCLLIPYSLFTSVQNFKYSFLLSLIIAVVVMIALYYQSVKKTGISIKWFWAWIGCLAVAISLQVFVIFKLL